MLKKISIFLGLAALALILFYCCKDSKPVSKAKEVAKSMFHTKVETNELAILSKKVEQLSKEVEELKKGKNKTPEQKISPRSPVTKKPETKIVYEDLNDLLPQYEDLTDEVSTFAGANKKVVGKKVNDLKPSLENKVLRMPETGTYQSFSYLRQRTVNFMQANKFSKDKIKEYTTRSKDVVDFYKMAGLSQQYVKVEWTGAARFYVKKQNSEFRVMDDVKGKAIASFSTAEDAMNKADLQNHRFQKYLKKLDMQADSLSH